MQVENDYGGDGAAFNRREQKRREKEEEEDMIDRVIETSPDHQPRLYLPPGFRFHPNDDELIRGYLLPKVQNKPLPCNHIKDVNLYNYNPEELTAKYKCSDREWFFFTPRDRKYKNGSRPNRAAGLGYWKATGADKPIISDGKTVGFRKALVFYNGKPPKGTKSSWIMHEFRVKEGVFEGIVPKMNRSSMRLDDWVLCRFFEKPIKGKVSKESTTDSPSDHENESPIACLIDYQNESETAAQTDYDNEQRKIVMQGSSNGNIMSSPEIKSEICYSSCMPTAMLATTMLPTTIPPASVYPMTNLYNSNAGHPTRIPTASVYPSTNLYNSNSCDPFDMSTYFEPLESESYWPVPPPGCSNSTLGQSCLPVPPPGCSNSTLGQSYLPVPPPGCSNSTLGQSYCPVPPPGCPNSTLGQSYLPVPPLGCSTSTLGQSYFPVPPPGCSTSTFGQSYLPVPPPGCTNSTFCQGDVSDHVSITNEGEGEEEDEDMDWYHK